MKSFLKWLYGIIFAVIGIVFLSTSLISSLFFFIAAAICLPPVWSLIDQKLKKSPSRKMKYSIMILSVIIGTIFYISGLDSTGKAAKEKRKQYISTLPKEQQDSIEKVQHQKERQEKIGRQFSPFDGSHNKLKRFVKKHMKDPDTYDHIETRYIDNGDYILVITKFRGANSFGAVVINNVTAKVDLDGEVLEIVSQD